MILSALVSYYEKLAEKGEISRPGWGTAKISYALNINDAGEPLALFPLKVLVNDGKKAIPRKMILPSIGEAKGNGIKPNFIWGNCAYIFGLTTKDNPPRAVQCFEAAKALHLSLLSPIDDPFAKAVCAFFEKWEPRFAQSNPIVQECCPDIKSANIVFMYNGKFANEDDFICKAWQHYYDRNDDAALQMRCLVTGEIVAPALVHPSVLGVRYAQAASALVSFNERAYESFGRQCEQGRNAPIGKYAAFAYTTALNRLIATPGHNKLIGDTTTVYWAESAEAQYQDAFAGFLDGGITDRDLSGVMAALAAGRSVDWGGLPLMSDNRFYVLGLAPNAARLSVRFFLRDTFGAYAAHLNEHYERLKIVRPAFDKDEDLPLWKLLRETVNPNVRDKSASPQLAGDTLRAILTGGRYPATLYQQTMLRIRAERDVSRGKAAILKACLCRNSTNEEVKEAATVALNEASKSVPYVLGRLFSLLEAIQDSASGASTVKDSYFNSACATPAAVFPRLLKLKNSHTKALMRDKPGLCITLEKQVTELLGRLDDNFPAHLTLEEQGAFILGYYHQTQKRYEKKNADNIEEEK